MSTVDQVWDSRPTEHEATAAVTPELPRLPLDSIRYQLTDRGIAALEDAR